MGGACPCPPEPIKDFVVPGTVFGGNEGRAGPPIGGRERDTMAMVGFLGIGPSICGRVPFLLLICNNLHHCHLK